MWYLDPIPGGCNLELPLQNDANIYLTASSSRTRVQFAYGDINISGVREPCGSSVQHNVPVYDVYQMYLSETQQRLGEETFFAAVGRMLKPEDIQTSARLVCLENM